LPFPAVLSLKTILPPNPSALKVLHTLEHKEHSEVEVGSLPLGEGGSLPLGEGGSLLLGEDRHPDSQAVEGGMEEGRADGDQEVGREQKVELHRDWAALLLVGKARVVGRMG
jgi:hypothetical protein